MGDLSPKHAPAREGWRAGVRIGRSAHYRQGKAHRDHPRWAKNPAPRAGQIMSWYVDGLQIWLEIVHGSYHRAGEGFQIISPARATAPQQGLIWKTPADERTSRQPKKNGA